MRPCWSGGRDAWQGFSRETGLSDPSTATRRRGRSITTTTCIFVIGMYEFTRTGQLLPILVGTCMDDNSGTDQQVPILSAEFDKLTGKLVPVGGTMEDPEGRGKRGVLRQEMKQY